VSRGNWTRGRRGWGWGKRAAIYQDRNEVGERKEAKSWEREKEKRTAEGEWAKRSGVKSRGAKEKTKDSPQQETLVREMNVAAKRENNTNSPQSPFKKEQKRTGLRGIFETVSKGSGKNRPCGGRKKESPQRGGEEREKKNRDTERNGH